MNMIARVSTEEERRRLEVLVPSKEVLRASGQVQSLSRALKLLNSLSHHAQGSTLSEVAHEVGLPTSTAHRLLTTLQNERYVRFDPERSTWLIGVQSFRVGSAFIRSRDLIPTARPFMRRLMEQSGETVNLAILDRGEVVYLAQVECQKMMRAIAGPGGRTLPHTSSVGKALMASMPEADALRILGGQDLRRETGNSLCSLEQLRRELASVRARGFAIDDEETAIGLRCLGSVIHDENGNALAALSVSGPTARLADGRMMSLGLAVKAIAAEITCEVGGRTVQ
ncbi:IclR family acetate operon transcriptional repressor [Rhodoligotrophos appendicifer]|uniref:IclR family transcriptional regulator n=1 Tax=Rhodoligotrophos appendicifer TaxID=987056 RepID=UPI0019615E92|nr:IclR family transcriptional regulator C-terminal domain-containing protein [Rhodoligotrophos appendicifer]